MNISVKIDLLKIESIEGSDKGTVVVIYEYGDIKFGCDFQVLESAVLGYRVALDNLDENKENKDNKGFD